MEIASEALYTSAERFVKVSSFDSMRPEIHHFRLKFIPQENKHNHILLSVLKLMSPPTVILFTI